LANTRQDLLKEARSAEYMTIFNRLGKKHVTKDSRSAAKAGTRGQQVLADIVGILRRGLIIGDEHVDGLGRGGSYLQTPPGCVMQSLHVDFDFVGQRRPGRREVPVSIWVALQDSSLYLERVKQQFKAGDVVVFAGDFRHAGAECDSKTDSTYRLFAYVPTRNIPVPWQVKPGMSDLARVHEVTDTATIEELHSKTSHRNLDFDIGLFVRHLYDAATNTFYRFDMQLWLSGLATNTTDKCFYASYVNGAPPFNTPQSTGKCPHFDPHDFNATHDEKIVLSNFRRQCKNGIYCQGRTNKRLRTEDEV
jgi:hypothetical protein